MSVRLLDPKYEEPFTAAASRAASLESGGGRERTSYWSPPQPHPDAGQAPPGQASPLLPGHRTFNDKARCTGPWVIVFETSLPEASEASEAEVAEVADPGTPDALTPAPTATEEAAPGGGHPQSVVRLWISYGTLTLQKSRKSFKPPKPTPATAARSHPITLAVPAESLGDDELVLGVEHVPVAVRTEPYAEGLPEGLPPAAALPTLNDLITMDLSQQH